MDYKLKTSHIFALFRIIKKGSLSSVVENLINSKETSAEKMGVQVMVALSEAMGNKDVEKEIYSLLASVTDKTETDIENQDVGETFSILKEIAKANDMQSVFTSAIQLMKN